MLHIILLILKILGCILLALLGLLLILLLIVLFVPIRYDISGSYYSSPDLAAKITWLFGIIKATAEFKDKQFRVRVALLWKTLFDTQNKSDSEMKITDSIEEQKLSDETLHAEIIQDLNTDSLEHEGPINPSEEESKKIQSVSSQSESKSESLNVNACSDEAEPHSELKKNKKTFSLKKKNKKEKNKKTSHDGPKVSFLEKILLLIDNLIDKIDDSIEHMEEKIDQLSCKWNKINRFIQAECTQNSIKLITKMLFSIIKHIIPRKAKGKIHFGLDKPSTTGKILGYASAFYPLYGESIHLEPDFENKVIEGELEFHGSIQLYIFVIWLIRAVLCKDIRKLIKYIKHLKG